MQVFRVLHVNDGIGPYRNRMWCDCTECADCMINQISDRLIDAYFLHPDRTTRWPIPEDDGMRIPFYPDSTQVFGFCSLDALLDWFGDWLPILESVGFVVASYEAHVRRDHKGNSGQIMFDISQAEFIEIW